MEDTVLRVTTGYDYTASIPDIDKNIQLNSINRNLIYSDFVMPEDMNKGGVLPTTSSHILCLVTKLKKVKARYRHQDGAWQSCELEAGCFGFGAAFDNGIVWQWDKENILGNFNELVVHFSPHKMEQIAVEVFDIDKKNIEIPHQKGNKDLLIEQMMLALQYEILQDNKLCSLYKECFLQLLSVHLLSRHCAIKRPIKIVSGKLSLVIQRKVTDYVMTNYHQQISLINLAELANMSVYHFSRLFKSTEGVSPRQYIIACRLRNAQKLLHETDIQIEQIALSTGFNSASHFHRMFKRYIGSSPVTYRTEIRK